MGLSDHTLGTGVAVASVALGAVLIEKHFTLSPAEGGIDAAFSLEPHEMRALVEETRRAYQALGRVHYGPTEGETKSLKFRRSIYVVRDIRGGDTLSPGKVRVIRPGYGLEPKHYDVVTGRRVNRDIKRGTPLKWEYLL